MQARSLHVYQDTFWFSCDKTIAEAAEFGT